MTKEIGLGHVSAVRMSRCRASVTKPQFSAFGMAVTMRVDWELWKKSYERSAKWFTKCRSAAMLIVMKPTLIVPAVAVASGVLLRFAVARRRTRREADGGGARPGKIPSVLRRPA